MSPQEGSIVVAVDEDGAVEYTLQSPAGVVGHVSEVTQTNDKLIFGSPFNNYLGAISLETVKSEIAALKAAKPGAKQQKPKAKQEL